MSAYVRQSHRARSTGTVVEVLDAEHPDSVLDPDGGRWATVCVPHGSVINHLTITAAKGHASEPEYWCELCMVAQPKAVLTVRDVIVATDLWNEHGIPARATGLLWIGHDHVDPIQVVADLLRDPDLLETVEAHQCFTWDFTGRNDAPPLPTAGYTETRYPPSVAPF